jgi:multidrug resistance efflux pump
MEEFDDLKIYSEEVKDVLSKPPKSIFRWGNTLLLLFILLMFLLSWFIKYPDIVASSAIITTKIPPQKEYANTTGKLDAILVSDNELVKAGQPLAIIENTSNYKDVFRLKSIIDTIKVNNYSFSFPVDSIPILFLGDIDSQYAIFENSLIQYELNKKLKPFSNEAIANRYSISELKRRLKTTIFQKNMNKDELEFRKKDINRSKLLFEKGIVSAREYENKQLEYAQAERSYKSFESSISQIREAISNAKRTSTGTEINRVKEEMITLKGVIQSFNQLKKVIRDWENNYVLTSNIEGKVSFMDVWSTNQTVNQGDLIFTIIPKENSSYIAKLKTPSQNFGKVKIGQKVNIRLQNYPDYEFGVLKGNITNISAIPNKEGLYSVDVSLPKELITTYNKKIDFKHEMRGTAEIITEDLRLIERFFYQFRKVSNRS